LDQFFKELREIQKKERSNSSLARIRSDFYKRNYKYLDKLKTSIGNDPFSNEHYLLKDIQRIATEICERREHKITDAAVMNIQRSYHLFKGKPKFDLQDTTPLNLTKEEEKLYFSLIDTLKTHRHGISLDKLTEDLGNGSAKIKSEPKNALENNSKALNLANEKITKEEITEKEIANEKTSDEKITNEKASNEKIANSAIEKNNALNNKNEINFEKAIKTDDESED
jgi:DNA replication factor GINS